MPEEIKTSDSAVSDHKKIRIGWFTFSCCEDNTIVLTEIMNDHWQEWKKLFDFRHVNVLKSKNVLDELDIAFIEGAIASDEHAEKLKKIRSVSKKLVAVGACAIIGMPAGQRNFFNEEQKKEIDFLLMRFSAMPKVLRVADVVKIDAEVPGCPMEPEVFLTAVNKLVGELSNNT
ncbi:MAG: hypothetical protein COU46_00665 [Candidatus Niyogibacteria bacterium CG10_big_fil_rev_8_21_14_0_10_42_19]|uniref:NADH:ubiquinone oxidoreductase-like 20kDa subunit domain-containing protein n=1 Tax=Candidatus Niyogibacteria bacterium CG10_big_fil_rev_8_21_14_0_10_42_19 TaxID=1974725 RepID=A0A2H0TGE2_9BACT|nr:MAG: hypothetical protein COU46_00665 [Candidatus Niyogibacteria bacterium CG10_big_fil_rev_8_21_14_0_10_42_19]